MSTKPKCALCGNLGDYGHLAVYAFPIILREMDILPVHGEYAHVECMIRKRIEISKYDDKDESRRTIIIETAHHYPYGRKRRPRKNDSYNRRPPNDSSD